MLLVAPSHPGVHVRAVFVHEFQGPSARYCVEGIAEVDLQGHPVRVTVMLRKRCAHAVDNSLAPRRHRHPKLKAEEEPERGLLVRRAQTLRDQSPQELTGGYRAGIRAGLRAFFLESRKFRPCEDRCNGSWRSAGLEEVHDLGEGVEHATRRRAGNRRHHVLGTQAQIAR